MQRSPSRILHLNIPVTNLEASLDFYVKKLGFQYVRHLREGKVILDFEGFNFFIEEADRNVSHERFHVGIQTTTEGVHEWAKHVEEQGIPQVAGLQPTGLAETYTSPDGIRTVFYIADPDGHILEFYSHIGVGMGFVRPGYGVEA